MAFRQPSFQTRNSWKGRSTSCTSRRVRWTPAISASSRAFHSATLLHSNQHHHHHSFRDIVTTKTNRLSADVISSPQSNTLKKIQALMTKRKKRNELRQTVVEGPRMVLDLLENSQTQSLVRQVLVTTDFYEEHSTAPFRSGGSTTTTTTHASSSPRNDVLPTLQLVDPTIFNKLLSDTVTPQGILAVVDIPSFQRELDFLPSVSPSSSRRINHTPLYLVLDGVSDPGNLGTLLRSALAVGVQGVILLPECCDTWNPKAVRSAMGASFQLPIEHAQSWEEGLKFLRHTCNVQRVYAATMLEDGGDGSTDDEDEASASGGLLNSSSGKNNQHHKVDWLQEPSALVIGSEGNGLSTPVRDSLRKQRSKKDNVLGESSNDKIVVEAVHVPMQPGIESLNAAICGSVILFEYARQRQENHDICPARTDLREG